MLGNWPVDPLRICTSCHLGCHTRRPLSTSRVRYLTRGWEQPGTPQLTACGVPPPGSFPVVVFLAAQRLPAAVQTGSLQLAAAARSARPAPASPRARRPPLHAASLPKRNRPQESQDWILWLLGTLDRHHCVRLCPESWRQNTAAPGGARRETGWMGRRGSQRLGQGADWSRRLALAPTALREG